VSFQRTLMATISPTRRVAVLGGGITGLTAAWQLQREGCEVVLFEKSHRVGGAIHSFRQDGWLHELGPNSLIEGSTAVAGLIDDLGLASKKIYASPEAKNRYIVKNGGLVPTPTSPIGFITTGLFSPWAKLQLLAEPWRPRHPGGKDESVADFVCRRLGREFLDYAINPFVGGVYAGDPERLSVKHAFPKLHSLEQQYGSLIRGAIKRRNPSGGPTGRIYSFVDGLETLPKALEASLAGAIRRNTAVRVLRRLETKWELVCEDTLSTTPERFDAVVCALPANGLSRLRFEGTPGEAGLPELSEIEHPPVVSLFLGYPRARVAHRLDGFGALAPEVEGRSILGALFSSTLFPGRAPTGQVGITVFVGGVRQPQLTQFGDERLINLVGAELKELLGVEGPPSFAHIQRWPHAIPQYQVGHQRFKDAIAAFELTAPGLLIGGNCRDGVSLPNCVESGFRLATAAAEFVPPR
jgi:oxygen-dependent protoporphyrinogen oxidase